LWQAGTYEPNDLVQDGDYLFIATTQTTERPDNGTNPPTPSDWDLLSSGGGSTTTIGPTFPDQPLVGDLHYMTQQPVGLYIWYDDGDSTQWVMTNGGSTGGEFVLKDGDTMTGNLTFEFSPAQANSPWAVYNTDWGVSKILHRGTHVAGVSAGHQFYVDPQFFELRNNGVGYAPAGWQTGSSETVKKNVRPLAQSAINMIGQLSTQLYERTDFTNIDGSEITQLGLFAEQVRQVLPSAVSMGAKPGTGDPLNPASDARYEEMPYYDPAQVLALLIEAFNELVKEVRGA
jgi:hypothetical protein